MHSRRLACFLLGLWLGSGFLLMWTKHENLASVERVLVQHDPAASLRINLLGRQEARLLLLYQASETNRQYGETWETVQVALGAVLLFFLLFGTREGKSSLAIALLLLILILVQRFALTPELNSMGRSLDFHSPALVQLETARYHTLETAYLAIEILKWVIQLILVAMLVLASRRRSRNIRQ